METHVAINAVTPDYSLPESFVMPTIEGLAALAIERFVNPHPDLGFPKVLTTATLAAIASTETVIAPLCVPARREVLAAFLWPLAGAVEYVPTESEFMRRVTALEIAAIEVPHVAWTRSAQRQLLQECARMPAVAAILGVVVPPVRRLISIRRAVAMINASSSKNAAIDD